MPGFPFGPMRPNTRAGLPLTARVLVPAVRRSLPVRGPGAAAARVVGRKGIVPAIAAPDARTCRRGRIMGFSFSLHGLVHVLSQPTFPCRSPLGASPHLNLMLVLGVRAFLL